jgi:succinoglycan biosynthesis transport protein ExoP
MKHLKQLPGSQSQEIAVRHVEPQPAPYYPPQLNRGDSGSTDDFSRWLEYWQIVRRHKGIVVLLALAGGLGAFLYTLYQTPIYRAYATVELQGIQEPFGSVRLLNEGNPYVQTQIKHLQSRTLRERVTSKMKPPEGPASLVADPLRVLRTSLGLPAPSGIPGWNEAVGMAAGTVTVLAEHDSQVVTLQCDSTDARVAADYINLLAAEYIDLTSEERWKTYQSTGDWLTRAQEELKKKLEDSENVLADYARSADLLFTSETQSVAEEKLKQLQGELARAAADRIGRQSQYETTVSSKPETLPAVLDHGPISHYQMQLADLNRQMAEMGYALTPEHPKRQKLQAQINELTAGLQREQGNILRRIRIEYDTALRREKQLENDFARQSRILEQQGEKLIRYKILKREVDTNRQLYEATLQRGKEASIASALQTRSAQVIDSATPPGLPYKPSLPMHSAFGLVCGLFSGVLLAFVLERSNSSIQMPGFLPFYLNVRELGVIPSAKADPEMRHLGKKWRPFALLGSSKRDAGAPGNGKDPRRDDAESVELVTWTRKPSLMAESFRATMASILFSGQNGNRPQIIILTSPSPKDGKSTIISNLAIAMAEINRRVLLIDADMRIPRLHKIFDITNSWGLSDVLYDRIPIEDYDQEQIVRKTQIPNLSILPSGPRRVSISSLLYSQRMAELLFRFRRDFDIVLIDTAPMLQISDARVLARLSDGVILVCRAGHTTRDVAIAGINCFEEDGTPVLGTILNNWDPNVTGYKAYSAYSEYCRNSQAS